MKIGAIKKTWHHCWYQGCTSGRCFPIRPANCAGLISLRRGQLYVSATIWLLARQAENKVRAKKSSHLKIRWELVPRAGLEPALAFKYQLDFKSNASTNSATEAISRLIESIKYKGLPFTSTRLFSTNSNFVSTTGYRFQQCDEKHLHGVKI